ncbi:uncharacterized protein SPSK_01312 [Sporothrix schenckii 1099-18]|uniref:Uncharacterized protein n=1 Tax=Sporothrix schenckii 1099-18 TaxID=1397361 RepID=A0A0F2LZR0_SPOSC|nr:uncharacterized protein SPSK_01312 [Sporothrix schenckii 1099-18]KJR81406.1 hypothetical protein SPSK_01312 [Sporothrix schenckii 1099-18]
MTSWAEIRTSQFNDTLLMYTVSYKRNDTTVSTNASDPRLVVLVRSRGSRLVGVDVGAQRWAEMTNGPNTTPSLDPTRRTGTGTRVLVICRADAYYENKPMVYTAYSDTDNHSR